MSLPSRPTPPPFTFGRSRGLHLSPIKEMELLASKIPGVVSLAQGIPSFDTPEPIRAYVREKLEGGECSRYSLAPGLPRLREAIAETLARDGMPYDPESEILVTCGAIEGIAATLLAALDPGDEVILPSPTYASYAEVVRLAGGIPRFVPLIEERNFDLDPEAIAAAIQRRTRAILFANPNNPTGTVFSRAQIERVAALAEHHGLLIITDEVYKDFLYQDAEAFTPARIDGVRGNVVRVFSFSKAFGMTGWRVGFVHSAAANITEILKVHDSLVTCAPVVSQMAALAALELGPEATAGFREEFRRRRNRTLEHLDRLSHVFDAQKPNAAYFVFPRVKDTVALARDSRRLALDILDRAHVALVPGIAFGPTGEAHLRLSYGRRVEDIDLAFERLEGYFLGARSEPPRERTLPRPPVPTPLRRLATSTLSTLARLRLARARPRIVGIAGLQAKTTLKRRFREILEPHLRLRTNPRSYNTEVGLPLGVLGVELEGAGLAARAAGLARAATAALGPTDDATVLVLEMGLRQAGDAAGLLRTLTPDLLVVTPITPSFENDLAFLEIVAREIRVLAEATTRAGGVVLACADDARVVAAVEGLPSVTSFSREHRDAESGAIRVGERTYEVGLELVGDGAVWATIAGVAVAERLGVPEAALRAALAAPPPQPG